MDLQESFIVELFSLVILSDFLRYSLRPTRQILLLMFFLPQRYTKGYTKEYKDLY